MKPRCESEPGVRAFYASWLPEVEISHLRASRGSFICPICAAGTTKNRSSGAKHIDEKCWVVVGRHREGKHQMNSRVCRDVEACLLRAAVSDRQPDGWKPGHFYSREIFTTGKHRGGYLDPRTMQPMHVLY